MIVTINAKGRQYVIDALRANTIDPDACVARIHAWLADIEATAENNNVAELTIPSSMSSTGREIVLELDDDMYDTAETHAVWHIEHHVAGVDEHIYFVAPVDVTIHTDTHDASLVSKHSSERNADMAAKDAARNHDGIDEANRGYRELWSDDNLADLADLINSCDGDTSCAYVAGAGHDVADSAVADVLGTDLVDLLSDVDSVADAVSAVINNVGAYVTARQYADHVLGIAQYVDNPRATLERHASAAMVADLYANASTHIKMRTL